MFSTSICNLSNAVISLGTEVRGKRSVSCDTQPFHRIESGNTKCHWNTVISWSCSEHWCWKSSIQAHGAAAAEPRIQVWVRWKRHETHPNYPLQSPKGCLEGWISCLHRQQAWRNVPCSNRPGGLAFPSPQESLRPSLVSLRSLDARGLGSPCVQKWP